MRSFDPTRIAPSATRTSSETSVAVAAPIAPQRGIIQRLPAAFAPNETIRLANHHRSHPLACKATASGA